MKLPAFAYHRAGSAADACAVLAEHAADARVLAGGQSLLPLMALRLADPRVLVDITAADDLGGHGIDGEHLLVQAGVSARRVETDAAVADGFPLVTATLGHSGHVETRNRGTVCGSLAHADPAAELPALLLAVDGTVTALSTRGRRDLPAAEFVTGPYTTALAADEVLVAVSLPVLPSGAGWSVREIARRGGDFALVGAVTVLDAGDDGRCTDARVAVFGAAGTPFRARAAEAALLGSALDDAAVGEAAARVFDDADVLGDLHGSATYRRRAGTRLVAHTLREARDRLRDEVTVRA